MKIPITKLLRTALLASVLVLLGTARAQLLPDATITFYAGMPVSPEKGVVVGAGQYTIKTPPFVARTAGLFALNKDGKEPKMIGHGTVSAPDAKGVGTWSGHVAGLKGGTYKVKAVLYYEDPKAFPPTIKEQASEWKEIEVAAP